MKRSKIERDNDDQKQLDSLTMANYLMYLSRGAGDHNNQEYDHRHHRHHQIEDSNIISSNSNSSSSSQSRVFECKTCNRKFASFQALGGHRASHKKPRLMGLGTTTCDSQSKLNSDTIKLKTHECTICGLEFAIGQALGGHMRKHRACSSMNDQKYRSTQFHRLNLINGSNSQVMPVVKKSDNTSRRVLFLDLNLTPLENDMNILQLEKGFSYG